jgi:hypothetical protein
LLFRIWEFLVHALSDNLAAWGNILTWPKIRNPGLDENQVKTEKWMTDIL